MLRAYVQNAQRNIDLTIALIVALNFKMYKTTICVMNTTVDKIKTLKIHPRQSNEDVILRLIKLNGGTVNDGWDAKYIGMREVKIEGGGKR